MKRLKSGLFITFEGGEGAGKTTLIDEVARYLTKEGYSFLRTREPGGTKLGEEVRNILLHQGSMSAYAELCLFLASRAQHIAEVIGPALEQKKIVLSIASTIPPLPIRAPLADWGWKRSQNFASSFPKA